VVFAVYFSFYHEVNLALGGLLKISKKKFQFRVVFSTTVAENPVENESVVDFLPIVNENSLGKAHSHTAIDFSLRRCYTQ